MNRSFLYRSAFALLALTLLGVSQSAHAQTAQTGPDKFRYRWVYLMHNLQVEENVAVVEGILKRAKAAGYNGAVIADYKLNILERVPAHYFKNIAKVKATADSLGLKLVPTVAGFGYSSGILAHDPNLAEGVPVKNAPFVVRENEAQIMRTPNRLPGGFFEQLKGNGTFTGWDYQDESIKPDKETVHGGKMSLRMETIGGKNSRVSVVVIVEPWRQYHLSFWVKTDNFARANDVRCIALPVDEKNPEAASVIQSNLGVKPTQDWTQYHAVFNSFGYNKVRLYLGVWGGTTGTLWIDDASLQESGMVNLLRRDTTPLTVKDAQTDTFYEEGRDFAPVSDPKLGRVPYDGEYEVYHAPPTIRLTPNSRIKDRQILHVSYTHTLTVYDNQVTASLTHPKVYEILGDQIQRVQKMLQPSGFFLAHDEIRMGGWDADAQKTGKTVGAQLAESLRRTVGLVRKANPKAEIFVWSDMFDPFHNAVGNYYLVNGSWANSWEGLPREAVIINWNSDKPRESIPFFVKRGHKQILAGYYDGDPKSIKAWLAAANSSENIAGVMYTTWTNNYDHIETFAKAVWGAN